MRTDLFQARDGNFIPGLHSSDGPGSNGTFMPNITNFKIDTFVIPPPVVTIPGETSARSVDNETKFPMQWLGLNTNPAPPPATSKSKKKKKGGGGGLSKPNNTSNNSMAALSAQLERSSLSSPACQVK